MYNSKNNLSIRYKDIKDFLEPLSSQRDLDVMGDIKFIKQKYKKQ